MVAREGGYDAVVLCRNCTPSAVRSAAIHGVPYAYGSTVWDCQSSLLCK